MGVLVLQEIQKVIAQTLHGFKAMLSRNAVSSSGIQSSMKRLERKHALAIRWFHWINFPLLAIMIWSGTLIYWANAVYIPLPKPLWQALHIGYRLAEGMAFHFFFMWLFGINGLLYVIYTIVSGEWRLLV